MVSEGDLWFGHWGVTVSRRTVQCACGGFIRAETHPVWIEQAVKRHRRRVIHRRWWQTVEDQWY